MKLQSNSGPPDPEQVAMLTDWGIDIMLPTKDAATGTIAYLMGGYPFHTKLSREDRIAFFKAMQARWIGQTVTYTLGSNTYQGVVSHIRGCTKEEALTSGRRMLHPLLVVFMITDERGKKVTHQWSLHLPPFNEPSQKAR